MDKLILQFKGILKKYSKVNTLANPHRHWVWMLNIFFTLLFLLISMSFYLLYEIKNDGFLNTPIDITSKNTLISRNEKLLNNVKNYFDVKSKKMESLKSNKLQLEDPRFKK